MWDEASRQVEQEQAPAPAREPGSAQNAPGAPNAPNAPSAPGEFHWDEDPHQRVVWGAEHARAKAARATEETLPNTGPNPVLNTGPNTGPNGEPADGDRG